MKKTKIKLVRRTIMISTAIVGSIGIIGYVTHKNLTNNQHSQSIQSEIATQLEKKDSTRTINVAPSGKKVTNKTTKPSIESKDVSIRKGELFNVLDSTSATDASGNDLTNKIKAEGNVDVNTPGIYTLKLTVSDTDGNETTADKKVTVEDRLDTAIPSSASVDSTSETSEVIGTSELAQTANSTHQDLVANNASETQSASTSPSYSASTMYVAGKAIPYQNGGQTYGQSIIDSNPDSMISTWGGVATQSGSDGQNTHFIGHNPGVFSAIFSLNTGNQIVVTDANGVPTTYTVSSIFQVDHYAKGVADGVNYWDTITGTGGGERITLQACVNNEINIIVIANA